MNTTANSTKTTVTPDPACPKYRFEVERFEGAGTMVTEMYGSRTLGWAAMGPTTSPEQAVDVYRNSHDEEDD